MTRFFSVAAGFVIFQTITAWSHAAIIEGVVATASSELSAALDDANLTNNSGISVAYSPAATHSASSVGADMWLSANSGGDVSDEFVTFALGGTFDLTTIYIWQYNQFGAVIGGVDIGDDLSERGVNQFDVLVSSDGLDFSTVALADQTLAEAPNTGATVSAESFALSNTGVTHVRIRIDSNHGSTDFVGLSEVMFDGEPTAVPEPSTLVLLSLGLLGLASRRVSRRRTRS